jgi:hypothetical protein
MMCRLNLRPLSTRITLTATTVAIFIVVSEFSLMYKSALQDRITLANAMNKKVVDCEITRNLENTKYVGYQGKIVGSSHEVDIV